MEQQYGDDFISITDEDGKEYELEVLAELEHNGSRYLALVPAGSMPVKRMAAWKTDFNV